MYYSRSTGGFYDPAIHGADIPSDAVEITTDEHAALLAGQAEGQRIVSGPDGAPMLADPPAPTEAELAAARCMAIQDELTAIDAASARPLRAILAAQASGGMADPADMTRIASLEAQAVALRAELAALEA